MIAVFSILYVIVALIVLGVVGFVIGWAAIQIVHIVRLDTDKPSPWA